MLRRRLVQLALGAGVVAVVATTLQSIGAKPPPPPPRTAEVTRGVVLASVSATGNVSVPGQLAVDFGSSGRLTELLARPGDRVRRGQPLARIDDASSREALAGARADLAAARAQLARLREGLTEEELAQARAIVEDAEVSVDNATAEVAAAEDTRARRAITRQSSVEQARAALATAEEAARQHAQSLDAGVAQAEARLAHSRRKLADDEARLEEDRRRASAARSAVRRAEDRLARDRRRAREIEEEMRDLRCDSTEPQSKRRCADLADRHAALMDAIADHQADLNRAESDRVRYEGYVRDGERAVEAGQTQVVEDEHTLADARHAREAGRIEDERSIQAARASLEDAHGELADGELADEQAVDRARQNLAGARSSLETSRADQAVKAQPPSPGEIAAQEATVLGARSKVEAAERTLRETTLRSPADGTVAVVNARAGEWVNGFGDGASTRVGTAEVEAPGSVSGRSHGLIVLTDLDAVQVKGKFSEADAARIRPGQAATVTLDALAGRTARAQVGSVDVIETVVSNVVTYEVTVLLDEAIEGVKPGMTAAVDVVVDQRRDVLRLPASVVTTRNNTATVTVLDAGGVPTVRSVTTGLKGDEEIEILGGLREGDRVVVGQVSAAPAEAASVAGER